MVMYLMRCPDYVENIHDKLVMKECLDKREKIR